MFWGNLLEKSAFLVSEPGDGPLLEHGPPDLWWARVIVP